LETAKKAQSEKYEYKVYFRKGMTYRDDSILRFINYPQKGRTTIKELEQNYKGVLSLEEIEKSLVKLVELNCLSLYAREEVTRKPKNPTWKTFRKRTLQWRERYLSSIRLFYQTVTKANTCNRSLFGKHG
jgi:hypothetical protein